MKIQFALLAVPFLALACSDAEQATLLEPPTVSADVTIEAAPLGGQYLHDVTPVVKMVSRFLYDVVPNTNITLIATVLFPNSDPVQKGAVTWYSCANKDGPQRITACENGTARWKRIRRASVDATGSATQIVQVSLGARRGFRYKYTGQGSGVKNGFTEAFDIRDTALNP
jgi:hypothetical protein